MELRQKQERNHFSDLIVFWLEELFKQLDLKKLGQKEKK